MNSHSNTQVAHLTPLAVAFKRIQDPRDPLGVRHDFQGMVMPSQFTKYSGRSPVTSLPLHIPKKTPFTH